MGGLTTAWFLQLSKDQQGHWNATRSKYGQTAFGSLGGWKTIFHHRIHGILVYLPAYRTIKQSFIHVGKYTVSVGIPVTWINGVTKMVEFSCQLVGRIWMFYWLRYATDMFQSFGSSGQRHGCEGSLQMDESHNKLASTGVSLATTIESNME